MIYLNKTDCIPLVETDMKQILLKSGMTFADSSFFKKSILATVGRPAIVNVQRRANLNNHKLMVTWTFK